MAGDFIKVQSELSELKRQKTELEDKLKRLDSNVAKRERELREKVVQLQAEKVFFPSFPSFFHSSGVNFINVFRARFSYQFLAPSQT